MNTEVYSYYLLKITLMFWMPTPEEEYVLYIIIAFWGVHDAIWQTQVNCEDFSVYYDKSMA